VEVDKFIDPPKVDPRAMERKIRRQFEHSLNELKTMDFAFEEFDIELEADTPTDVRHNLKQLPGQISIQPLGEGTVFMAEEPDNDKLVVQSDAAITVRVRVTK